MLVAEVIQALANERRVQILAWLKDPVTNFPPQRDGDLVEDGVCGLFIADKLGVTQPTAGAHLKILVRSARDQRMLQAGVKEAEAIDRHDQRTQTPARGSPIWIELGAVESGRRAEGVCQREAMNRRRPDYPAPVTRTAVPAPGAGGRRHNSTVAGKLITPTTGPPSARRETSTPYTCDPSTNDVVPSSGSMTHCSPDGARA